MGDDEKTSVQKEPNTTDEVCLQQSLAGHEGLQTAVTKSVARIV